MKSYHYATLTGCLNFGLILLICFHYTSIDWAWVAISVGTLLLLRVVIVVVVILMQRCRHTREQAAAYNTEPPPLPTPNGMRGVRSAGGRSSGVYGEKTTGNGSGSEFGTGGAEPRMAHLPTGVSDFVQKRSYAQTSTNYVTICSVRSGYAT